MLKKNTKILNADTGQKVSDSWPIVNRSIFFNAFISNADNKTKTTNRFVTHKELPSRQ